MRDLWVKKIRDLKKKSRSLILLKLLVNTYFSICVFGTMHFAIDGKTIIPGNRSRFNFFHEKLRVFLAGDSVNVGIRKLKITKMKKLLFFYELPIKLICRVMPSIFFIICEQTKIFPH